MIKIFSSLLIFFIVFISGAGASTVRAQSDYVPVIFLTSDAKQVVAENPVNLTLVANTLGTVLRRVEAYVVLEGEPVPNNGYTYALTPRADERFDVQIYEEISGQNSRTIHVMMSSSFQDGANWESEAVPVIQLRFIPETSGTIKAFLSDESGVSYNNQESSVYGNYTPYTRPYLITVVGLNAQPTPIPRPLVSHWPTYAPTQKPTATPSYEDEYRELKKQVEKLQNTVGVQEERLSFIETVVMRIREFFARIFGKNL